MGVECITSRLFVPTLLHTTRGVSDQCIWRRAEYAVNLLHQEEKEVEESADIGLASSAFSVVCAEESNTLLRLLA